MNRQKLEEAGINYAAGLERFLEDQELYEGVLQMFLDDQELEPAQQAYKEKNYDALLEHVHAIKGVSGNTDMTKLYEASSSLVALIRSKNFTDAEMKASFEAWENAYITVQEGIRQA